MPAMVTVQPSSDRRASQSAFRYGLASIVGSAVVGDEELLQVGLLAQQVDHGVLGGRLDQRVGPTIEAAVQGRVGDGDVLDPGQGGELLHRYRRLEVDLDPAYRPLA